MTQWNNTKDQFGWTSRSLHWIMGLIILGLLGLGFWMEQMAASPEKFELYGVHKSLGMLILGLAVIRLSWRFIMTVPAPLQNHQKWERTLAKTIQIVLYISILVMPLSGWLMSSFGGYPVSFFGLFEFPQIIPENKAFSGIAKTVHTVSAFTLTGALGLHILGAFKHHVIDRDDTLRRMGGNLIFVLIGLGLLSVPTWFTAQNVLEKFQAPESASQETQP